MSLLRSARLPQPTDRHRLTDGLQVSPFCLGLAGDPDTVLAAYDAGINFFFLTCDMHWPMYEGLRRGLERLIARGGGVRDRIVVALVSYVTQPPFQGYPFVEGIESVAGLGHADVLVLGGVYQRDLLPRLERVRANVDAGLVSTRAIGASLHERTVALQLARYGLVDIGFLRHNTSHPGARVDVFPHLPARHPLFYNFTSTTGFVSPARIDQLGVPADLWRPSVTDHYRFALSFASVDGILCGLRSPAELAALVAAAAAPPLDEGEVDYLINLSLLHQGKANLG